MTINESQDEIVENFSLFDTWDDRYAYIIELGKNLASLPEVYKTDDRKIKGCQSNVWLYSDLQGDRLIFKADSDALIVKGLVSLLIGVLSNHSPEEILQADLYFVEKIGMKQHLSMTRANGLVSMIKQMKYEAMAYQSQNN